MPARDRRAWFDRLACAEDGSHDCASNWGVGIAAQQQTHDCSKKGATEDIGGLLGRCESSAESIPADLSLAGMAVRNSLRAITPSPRGHLNRFVRMHPFPHFFSPFNRK